jgi:hypothetical protein
VGASPELARGASLSLTSIDKAFREEAEWAESQGWSRRLLPRPLPVAG